MIDSLFFDSDCISAFLWVKEEGILTQLYAKRIVLPKSVYDELSYPRIAHLRARVDAMLAVGAARVEAIDTDTKEYQWYYKLTAAPENGRMVIGKGEAAALVLARSRNGIVASNNLKDICFYRNEFGLLHKTTGDILVEALRSGVITERQGNRIWENMLARRRKIGADSFSEYLRKCV